MKKYIIGIDFDGTIVENAYPGIGEIFPFAKETINKLYADGHQILIWSCRSNLFTPGDKDNMIKFLDSNSIKYHKINENSDIIESSFPKIYYDILIDDHNLFHSEDWKLIYYLINERSKKEQ